MDGSTEAPRDLYAMLDIARTDDQRTITQAYYKLSQMFHPDKVFNPTAKKNASREFKKVKEAYEILSNENSKRMYDLHGEKGLKKSFEIIERKRTPEEMKREYDRLQKEEEERRILQRTNPSGSFSMMFDTTGIFDDHFYQKRWYQKLNIQGLLMNQSIETPLTESSTLVMDGSMTNADGNSRGNLACTLRHRHSNTLLGEVKVTAGNTPAVGVKLNKSFNRKTSASINLSCTMHYIQGMLACSPGIHAMIQHQLANNLTGALIWDRGLMTTRMMFRHKDIHTLAQVQLCPRGSSHAMVQARYEARDDTDIELTLRLGLLNSSVEYGVQHQISSLSRLSAMMNIDTLNGITLKIFVHRYSQSFVFPIHLSQELSLQAMFYGTAIPLALFWVFRKLVIYPYLKKQEEKIRQENRERNADIIAEKRVQAMEAQEMMFDRYNECLVREEEAEGASLQGGGLIIDDALYGLIRDNSYDKRTLNNSGDLVVDVTKPLQCLIERRKTNNLEFPMLEIQATSNKVDLNGFYDPCIGEEKQLSIKYTYMKAKYYVVFRDKDIVKIPKQAHCYSDAPKSSPMRGKKSASCASAGT